VRVPTTTYWKLLGVQEWAKLEAWQKLAGSGAAMEKALNSSPHFVLGDLRQTVRLGIATVIGAWFVRTCFALDDLRRGMERGKPLRQLGAEQSHGRDHRKGRQMPRTGIVADKITGMIHQREQFCDSARCCHFGFARI